MNVTPRNGRKGTYIKAGSGSRVRVGESVAVEIITVTDAREVILAISGAAVFEPEEIGRDDLCSYLAEAWARKFVSETMAKSK